MTRIKLYLKVTITIIINCGYANKMFIVVPRNDLCITKVINKYAVYVRVCICTCAYVYVRGN